MNDDTKSESVKVVILGAGGLSREAYWVFCDANEKSERHWEVFGFIDENPATWTKSFYGVSVLGNFQWFESVDKNKFQVVCTVGSPRVKKSMVEKAEHIGLNFCTVIHPSVQASENVELGFGTVITAGCILTTEIEIGNHVYINLDTTIGHDVTIQDFVNIAPGCHISGNVTLMEGADLGTGAVVLQGLTIGKWSTVGAGAVVLDNVPDNTVVVGTPAEVIKYKEQPE